MLQVNYSHSDKVSNHTISTHYSLIQLRKNLESALNIMLEKHKQGLKFPYFSEIEGINDKSFELDIYITDVEEAKVINAEARGKDYATNILSYPSDLPISLIKILPAIMLGELIICHEVIVTQAQEQHKKTDNHITHLIVHGLLHLLGFDHEIGDIERIEMEAFEIEILKNLEIKNPYMMEQ